MKVSSLLRPFAGEPTTISRSSTSILLALSLATTSHAFTFNSIPSTNLETSSLGRVGILGDFSGLSIYEFEGQNEDGYNTNNTQSVMAQLPNGVFANLVTSDAHIHSMCSFSLENGTTKGVMVGGNFTSLGGIESQGVAMFNPNTSTVSPLTGLNGQVYALLCDEATNTVYVGGQFQGANSTNAIAWSPTTGWTNLPFFGFNGMVNAISKAPNGNVVFGGIFTGLGNATTEVVADQQIVNIQGANITSSASSTTAGFSDPRNIICKTSGVDGSNNTWLLEDDTNGSWTATFGFTFFPTKLRLWNTHQDGRGTKTWRYTAMPINGIMNFTYTDPSTGHNESCTSTCPLSSNSSVEFQDFFFVNYVGMNSFRIDISDWYGQGGGLDGIELFQDDIFAYAVDTFNEPTCASISFASDSTNTGPWVVTPSGTSDSEYLTASSLTTADEATASVVFFPDIKQSGNYSVNMYTPGCLGDDTCDFRGQVNVTVTPTSSAATAKSTPLFQTNNYEKYDQIFFGYVDAGSSSFRPSVTLYPVSGQDNLTVVAQRVSFILVDDSASGLNGLFEYNPSEATVDTSSFANSTFDVAGNKLNNNAGINSLVVLDEVTYVGGDFTTTNYANIFAVNSSSTVSLSAGGLNGEVLTMALNDTTLFVGGTFNNTFSSKTSGLSNVAAYDTSSNTWSALGAGLDGAVSSIVPISMNITANTPERVITMTGTFTNVLAFGTNSSIPVSGFAIWVPSRANWLQNLDVSTAFLNGLLSTAVDVPGGTVFAGSLSSQQLDANGAALLWSPGLSRFPVQLEPSTSVTDDSPSSKNVSGVVTASFYSSGSTNITILGGHFAARGSNGSTINNLVFMDNTVSDVVTGIGPQISNDSTFLATALSGDTLYAGGAITGTINGDTVAGIISYDMKAAGFTPTQPPALSGGNQTVNAIAIPSGSTDVYVGGDFTLAGSLPCPGVCVFVSDGSQWTRPGGAGLSGTVNTMFWATSETLIVGGSLTVAGASASLATYDVKTSTWAIFNNAASIPGPVTSLVAANSKNTQFWVAGTAKNGSDFIIHYDGTSTWTPIDVLGSGSEVRGLQVFMLADGHDSGSSLLPRQALIVTGALNVPGFGSASSAVFNGTTLQPFILSTKDSNSAGSIAQITHEKPIALSDSNGKLALGFIVLIGLAIALALTFLLVVGGTVANRIQRRREGYVPAPTNFFDKSSNLDRVPPERLFGSMAEQRNPPMI